jgi:thiamine pyrophosphate-dependent acetolactate synthase large subunit-like protein
MTGVAMSSVPVLPRRTADPDALLECADEIIERLTAAKNAVIIVDVEIRRYGLEGRATTLARKFGLPVVSTFTNLPSRSGMAIALILRPPWVLESEPERTDILPISFG